MFLKEMKQSFDKSKIPIPKTETPQKQNSWKCLACHTDNTFKIEPGTNKGEVSSASST